MSTTTTIAELPSLKGQELGTSEWVEITQDRVNLFADATGDHQWIHVDVERANAESPFGGPIAHGYLTLSLIIPMYSEVLAVTDAKMGVNYGLNKVRFPAPVPVGAKVRLTATLKDVEEVAGGLQVTVAGVIEAEGGEQAGLHRRAGLPHLRLTPGRAPGVFPRFWSPAEPQKGEEHPRSPRCGFRRSRGHTAAVSVDLRPQDESMPRYGAQYGPDVTFLGVDRCDLDDAASYAGADVVVLGAPFDGGTSHRPGTRFGPQAIRMTDYLPHDGSRPSLALRTDGLRDLRVLDAGDVEMYSGDIETALPALEAAVEKVARAGAIPVDPRRRPLDRLRRRQGRGQRPRPRPGVDDPLRRARRHRRHRVRLAVGPRPADAPADRVGRAARRPVPADRPARLLAAARRRWTGWPRSGCAPTR